jgi:hypothetical protein
MERYRVFWDGSFDRLDAHLRRVQQSTRQGSVHRREGAGRKEGARRREED